MPVPAAVGAVAQILGEAAEIRRPGPVRVVLLDRVRHFVERREAVVHVLGHEGADAHPALFFHPGCDVDEHECAAWPRRDARRSPRATRCRPATRPRARAVRRAPARSSEDVAREGVERVVAVGGPSRSRRALVGRRRRPANLLSPSAPSVVPHEWRVWPPPCSSTTGEVGEVTGRVGREADAVLVRGISITAGH